MLTGRATQAAAPSRSAARSAVPPSWLGVPTHPDVSLSPRREGQTRHRLTSTSTPTLSGPTAQPAALGPLRASSPSATAAAVPASAAPPLACEVQRAASAAELRAAAFLRAVSFYTYPPGRSEYAARSHRHMKANAEWESVTAKVEGTDVAYRDLDVTCYIATVEDLYGPAPPGALDSGSPASADDPGSEPRAGAGAAAAAAAAAAGQDPVPELLASLRSSLDASAQLPAEPAGPGGSPPGRQRRLVVGSLDLNVGHTLPSEELIGRSPQGDPRHRRAYLSNVCVAPAARRLGVARALLRHVEEVARRAGVEWLYVHVVADNTPAVGLYCGAMGFQVEQSETEGYARSLQRPRRLLLGKCLLQPTGETGGGRAA